MPAHRGKGLYSFRTYEIPRGQWQWQWQWQWPANFYTYQCLFKMRFTKDNENHR